MHITPHQAVETSQTLVEALHTVGHGMVGDGGGPTFDQECGADAMRERCIEVAELWLERKGG